MSTSVGRDEDAGILGMDISGVNFLVENSRKKHARPKSSMDKI